MDLLNQFIAYLVDKERHMSGKAAMLFVAVVIGLLINDVTGFTYHYNTKSKIEQIKDLNEIVLNDSTPVAIKVRAQALEMEILDRKTIPDIGMGYVSKYYGQLKHSLASYTSKSDVKTSQPTTAAVSAGPSIQPRNNFLLLMSSSGVLVFLAIFMIPAMGSVGFSQGWGTALAGFVVVELCLGTLIAVFYFTLGLIPMIAGTWTWSYVISIFVQVAVITLTIMGVGSSKKSV